MNVHLLQMKAFTGVSNNVFIHLIDKFCEIQILVYYTTQSSFQGQIKIYFEE